MPDAQTIPPKEQPELSRSETKPAMPIGRLKLRIALYSALVNIAGGALLYLYFSEIDISTLKEWEFSGSYASLFFLFLPFLIGTIATLAYGRELFAYLQALLEQKLSPLPETNGGGRIIHYRRRALRYPLLAGLMSLIGWSVTGVVMGAVVYAYASGYLRLPSADIIPVPPDASALDEALLISGMSLRRAFSLFIQISKTAGLSLMTGIIAGTCTFFLVESLWQPYLHFFFPRGRISEIRRWWFIPVQVRLLLIFIMVGTVPLLMLGIMSYQRAARLTTHPPEEVLGNLLLFNMFMIGLGVFLAVMLSIFVARSVSRPLASLREAMERVQRGDLDIQVIPQAGDEIGLLAEDFDEMVRSLRKKEEEIRELTQGLEEKVRERTRELREALAEKERTQTQLIQSEKLASLGQLVAGVAHELNNPISFVYANTDHFSRYLEKLEQSAAAEDPQIKELLQKLKRLVQSTREGARRTKDIVTNLRTFSRLDEVDLKQVDLHEGLESTLGLLTHELKNRIQVHKEYGTLPSVLCYAGQMNQVFMNLLTNAVQAIPDQGDIWIRTWQEPGRAMISIRDNGKGIAPEHLPRIFDPFFTTKEVGKGTGLGLSITYGIIQKHQGRIAVDSEPGKGTTVVVSLPVRGPEMII